MKEIFSHLSVKLTNTLPGSLPNTGKVLMYPKIDGWYIK